MWLTGCGYLQVVYEEDTRRKMQSNLNTGQLGWSPSLLGQTECTVCHAAIIFTRTHRNKCCRD